MNRSQKREVIATLLRVGRRDLANVFSPCHLCTGQQKVLVKVPDDIDASMQTFLKILVDDARLRVGYDARRESGSVDIGRYGDILFASSGDSIHIGINDIATYNVEFKRPEKAAQAVREIAIVAKKWSAG